MGPPLKLLGPFDSFWPPYDAFGTSFDGCVNYCEYFGTPATVLEPLVTLLGPLRSFRASLRLFGTPTTTPSGLLVFKAIILSLHIADSVSIVKFRDLQDSELEIK